MVLHSRLARIASLFFTVLVVFIAAAGSFAQTTTPLQFVPVTPCRVVDTRNAVGPFGGPALGAGTSREFEIPQSACKIPSSAMAYSLNVTVVPQITLGYLTIWPSGQPQPVVSTLNSVDGRVKANAAITPAGTNGGVSVYVTNETQVILDIDGYFVSKGTASALAFYPVTPCRVVDTRNAVGPLGGPFMAAGSSRAFPVQSSSCGLPANAQVYSLNVTVVPSGDLGYLTMWPGGEPQPLVSTLNATTGTYTANAAIVPAAGNGDVSVYVTNSTDVVLDVDGYFAAPATGGLSLYTTTPCRVLDTRQTSGAFNGVLEVEVAKSACAPPSGAQAYVLNATVVPPGALGFLSLWPNGESQPTVSTLNAIDGAITSNMAIVPTNNGNIDAFSSNPTQLILDLSSYFADGLRYPVADAGGPYTGTAGTAITFKGSGSTDPQGQPLTYAWNFGDSSTGTGVSPTHTYTAAGIYTISLTVTDTSHLSSTATSQATVGSALVAVPNVVGQTQAAAAAAITSAGLVLGTVTTQASSTVPSGSVISESPIAGTPVNAGSAVNLVVSSGPPPLNAGNINLIFVVSGDLTYQAAGDVSPQTANLTDQGLNRSLLIAPYLQENVLGNENVTGIYALEPMTHLQTASNYPDMAALETIQQFALLNHITISSEPNGATPLPGNSFPLNASYAPAPVPLPSGVATPLITCRSCQGLDFNDQEGDNQTLVDGIITAKAPGFYVFSAPWETASALLANINQTHSYNLSLPASYAGPNYIYAISIASSGSANLVTFNSSLNPPSTYPALPSPPSTGNACTATPFNIAVTGGGGGAVIPTSVNTNEIVYIIRHAEAHPEPNWDDGNYVCAGQWRALDLPNALRGKIDPQQVYSIDPAQALAGSVSASGNSDWSYVRPALTVEPYAIANNLPYHLAADFELDAQNPPQLATQASNFFFTDGKFSTQSVLLAWEHAHIPTTVNALLASYYPNGGAPTAPDWSEDDYDSIWTVTLDAKGNLTVNNNMCEGIVSANLPATCPAF